MFFDDDYDFGDAMLDSELLDNEEYDWFLLHQMEIEDRNKNNHNNYYPKNYYYPGNTKKENSGDFIIGILVILFFLWLLF